MLRSEEGIVRLINLETLCYSSMILLPYLNESFAEYQGMSPQETRSAISERISKVLFFDSLLQRVKIDKNTSRLSSYLENIREDFCA